MDAIYGKRKFIAFLVTIGTFFLVISFVIFFVMPIPATDSEVTALGTFAGLLGSALMVISGAFYAGNVLKKLKDENNKG